MKEIPLPRGLVALVDDEDFKRVSQYRWQSGKTNAQSRTRYAYRHELVDGKKRVTYLHRFILGAPAGMYVDHINHDGLDCRRANMRLVTPSQNRINGRRNRDGRSRFKGVSPTGAKFKAQVGFNCEPRYFGMYDSEETAARVYDAAARRLHGEFAHTNFPTIDPEADAIAARLIAEKGLEGEVAA